VRAARPTVAAAAILALNLVLVLDSVGAACRRAIVRRGGMGHAVTRD